MTEAIKDEVRSDGVGVAHDEIRLAAYYIWLAAGSPEGCALAHWLEAETRLLAKKSNSQPKHTKINSPAFSSAEHSPAQGRIPKGTKRIVIFDTNAYRYFAPSGTLPEACAKAVRLRQCEQAASVLVLASPTVVWELIAHLADPTDRYYNQCLKSLVMLGEHAVDPAKPTGGISLISDAESAVCRELFRLVPTVNEQGIRSLGSLVKHVGKYAPDLTDPKARENIQKIASHVYAFEKDWLNIMQPVLQHCDPKVAKQFFGDIPERELRKSMADFFVSQIFANMWASFTVQMYATKVGYTINSDEDLKQKAQLVLAGFPVPFHLMSALLQKIAMDPNFNLSNPDKKRWNFVWDSQLTFSIGSSHTIAGVPLFFVTSDAEILAAAKSANCGEQVIALREHLKSVGFV
jgi:hypothetical protein